MDCYQTTLTTSLQTHPLRNRCQIESEAYVEVKNYIRDLHITQKGKRGQTNAGSVSALKAHASTGRLGRSAGVEYVRISCAGIGTTGVALGAEIEIGILGGTRFGGLSDSGGSNSIGAVSISAFWKASSHSFSIASLLASNIIPLHSKPTQ
jgi:hypothetical protein